MRQIHSAECSRRKKNKEDNEQLVNYNINTKLTMSKQVGFQVILKWLRWFTVLDVFRKAVPYGPACVKALCPHVLVDFGMIRAREVDERKFRAGIYYGWTREILYWGAEPGTQWKISNKIFNW